jgi:hypothetical protein
MKRVLAWLNANQHDAAAYVLIALLLVLMLHAVHTAINDPSPAPTLRIAPGGPGHAPCDRGAL